MKFEIPRVPIRDFLNTWAAIKRENFLRSAARFLEGDHRVVYVDHQLGHLEVVLAFPGTTEPVKADLYPEKGFLTLRAEAGGHTASVLRSSSIRLDLLLLLENFHGQLPRPVTPT